MPLSAKVAQDCRRFEIHELQEDNSGNGGAIHSEWAIDGALPGSEVDTKQCCMPLIKYLLER
jgi:hypothetical protein